MNDLVLFERDWNIRGSIVFRKRKYDAKNLNKKVVLIRNFLRRKNIAKTSVVAIFMERGVWSLALMFALLQEGIAFLPIDITLPKQRWQYMMDYLNIYVVFADEKYKSNFEDRLVFSNVDISQSIKVETRYTHIIRENATAYYLYTSGTTGKPKAVEVTQRGLINFIEAIPKKIPMMKNQKIGCFTSMSFDIFFLESVLALQLGMQVVLASEEEKNNPKEIIRMLKESKVEIVQFTPSHIQMLQYCDKEFSCFQDVTTILVGGEALPYNLLIELQRKTSSKIYNMYGPTETTIWSSIGDLTNAREVHIGLPIMNTEFYIINEDKQLVVDGQIGELCIAGYGLANGYKGDKLLTNSKFIIPEFNPNLILYCTGDVAKYVNGNYYCLGRKDNQIKYRGHRIELEEIDSTINELIGVIRAITYFENKDDTPYMITLYEGCVGEEYIKESLQGQLAEYMIPKRIINVNRLYLSANGKVDRNLNYEVYVKNNCKIKEDFSLKSDDFLENQILSVFQNKLCLREVITLSTSICELSIDSLEFIRIIVEIEEMFQISFESEKLLNDSFETIRDVVMYVKMKKAN